MGPQPPMSRRRHRRVIQPPLNGPTGLTVRIEKTTGQAVAACPVSVDRGSFGGAEGARTPDPKTASLVLSQLSYSPTATLRLSSGAELVKHGRYLPRTTHPGERSDQAPAACLAALS